MRRFLFAETQTISHFGLLLLRLGIGTLMFFHGLPKLMGGAEMWAKVGGAMKNLGLDFAPTFWGFLATFAEASAAAKSWSATHRRFGDSWPRLPRPGVPCCLLWGCCSGPRR